MATYTLYGDVTERSAASWALVLRAKHQRAAIVPETASLSLLLASRSGHERGPYLRTPEGFVLAGGHEVLAWLEQVHPHPALLPPTPVRRTCARMLEDWIDLWLPSWPRRSWASVDRLGRHLETSRFLLGASPTRADFQLAAWLETEVLVRDDVRARTAREAPKLLALGEDLLSERESVDCASDVDDTIPISLLGVLEDIALDYHGYLIANQRALKDERDTVTLDLGLGPRPFPVQRVCERRRVEIGRSLAALEPAARRSVARVLEPVGAWHALTLPPVLDEVDPSDPRSL